MIMKTKLTYDKLRKYITFILIITLMFIGVYRVTNKDIISCLEGILLIISSYLLLFTCSKLELLPIKIAKYFKCLIDISDND